MIKIGKFIDVFPYGFVLGMEYMSAIFVDINSFNFFTIDIASDVISFIDNKATLTMFFRCIRKNGAVKSCADYQTIIFYFPTLLCQFQAVPIIFSIDE